MAESGLTVLLSALTLLNFFHEPGEADGVDGSLAGVATGDGDAAVGGGLSLFRARCCGLWRSIS